MNNFDVKFHISKKTYAAGMFLLVILSLALSQTSLNLLFNVGQDVKSEILPFFSLWDILQDNDLTTVFLICILGWCTDFTDYFFNLREDKDDLFLWLGNSFVCIFILTINKNKYAFLSMGIIVDVVLFTALISPMNGNTKKTFSTGMGAMLKWMWYLVAYPYVKMLLPLFVSFIMIGIVDFITGHLFTEIITAVMLFGLFFIKKFTDKYITSRISIDESVIKIRFILFLIVIAMTIVMNIWSLF